VVLAIAVLATTSADAWGVRAADPQRGSGIAAAKCAVCHGTHGNSKASQYPKLAGQNPRYLYYQLQAFKAGERRSSVMSTIVAGISNADLADVASFYARQTIQPDRVTDKSLAAAGKNIFFNGTAGGTVPACATCHSAPSGGGMPMMGRMSMMGRGMKADVPNLNGQHAAYTVARLAQFAAGERPATVMDRIAASLSAYDGRAVAEYISGLR